jgi:hypothetical protein
MSGMHDVLVIPGMRGRIGFENLLTRKIFYLPEEGKTIFSSALLWLLCSVGAQD